MTTQQNASLFSKSLESLDWPFIREHLVNLVGSMPGRELAAQDHFADSLEQAQHLQDETSEIRRLLDTGGSIPIGGIRDLRPYVASAARGEVLVGRELLEIADSLNACHQLKRFFTTNAERCPRVHTRAMHMHDLYDLSSLLGRSFDNNGELSTTTYPQLAELRGRIQALHNRIKERLTVLMNSDALGQMVQEHFVTVRSDRYVVPLKIQARSTDIGIVHDTSGSGQTVFVEPRQVVGMNNDLKIAEAELRREERRILLELSHRVAIEEEAILHNLWLAAALELIHARARLSQELSAYPPVLVRGGYIKLRSARHPVLALRKVDVIPNDLTIGQSFQALVLSGPNTGGKTVALKTLGLAALMARAGMHVPADVGSEVGFFAQVLTDIGDQQTIEQDLSTFSGHMLRINEIVKQIGNDGSQSLVLLDEIAVGTDPAQGAALARAILEAFVDRGTKVVVTTHYTELKTLSVNDPRFANGRVEFDAVALRPTFRVVLGHPGRSYALDIASRLGLEKALVAKAQSYLGPDQKAVEDLLGELETSLVKARDEQLYLERERVKLEQRRKQMEARLEAVEKEAEQLRVKALSGFERDVRVAREEITRLVQEVQQGTANRAKVARVVREKISTLTEEVKKKVPSLAESQKVLRPVDPKQLKVGLRVHVAKMKKDAIVSSVPHPPESGLIEVQINGLKIKVPLADLREAPPLEASPPERQVYQPIRKAQLEDLRPQVVSLMPSPEENELSHAFQSAGNVLDLRGVRVDEGLDELERFLDRASADGESIVFVIHGHGTGAMKKAVREALARSPYVERFQPGGKNQGGDGATVVGVK